MNKKLFVVFIALMFLFSCGKDAEDKTVNVQNGEEVALEQAETELSFEEIDSHVFYAIENLKLRETAGLEAKEITVLPKGTKVKVLEIGEASTIDDVYAFWKKVCSEDNQIGWCFSAYLSNKEEKEQEATIWKPNNFPTSPSYLLGGVKYKSLVTFKRWEKAGIEAKVKDALAGDVVGHSYTMDDVGRQELIVAILFDENKNILMYDEFNPYDFDEYHFRVNVYNSNGKLVDNKQFLPSRTIPIFSDEFFNEFDKVKQTDDYKNSTDKWHQMSPTKLTSTINKVDKNLAGKSVSIEKGDGYYIISYDSDGRIINVVPKEDKANNLMYDSCKFYDVVYNGEKLSEVKFKENFEYEDYLRYVFTKYDDNGNWLEAKVFENTETEPIYTLIRKINYYQ